MVKWEIVYKYRAFSFDKFCKKNWGGTMAPTVCWPAIVSMNTLRLQQVIMQPQGICPGENTEP